jgi:uncharacterized OB-fold protein
MSSELLPSELDPLTQAHWDALQDGELRFQRCVCGHAWLPPRPECPSCLTDRWSWEVASGAATLVSWVVYHRAFHPAMADRLPYAVALVQLAEGPRLVAQLVDVPGPANPVCDAPLRLTLDTSAEPILARFALLEG